MCECSNRLFLNLCVFLPVLVGLPLGKPLADGILPCMSLGDILSNLPLLQHLDVRYLFLMLLGTLMYEELLCVG